jgi:hypothetical protein
LDAIHIASSLMWKKDLFISSNKRQTLACNTSSKAREDIGEKC